MPLDVSTIAKHRHAVASKDRKAALLEISKLHPKITIPILIAIIQEAICKIPAGNDAENMRSFLKYAEELLVDLHKKQNASILKLPSILKEFTKERITKELTELVNKVDLIKMQPELLEISKEAELWLQGWYLHTYDMAEKDKSGNPVRDKNGAYHRIDSEDTIYYNVVGMTKLETATYYGKVAELLRKKISSFQEKPAPVVVQQPQEPVVNPVPTIDVVIKEGVATISVRVLTMDINLIERIKTAITSAFSPSSSQVIESEESSSNEEVNDADLASFLKCFSTENNDIKIQMLEYIVHENGLTELQNNLLRNLKANMIAKFDNYINDPYVVPFTKIPISLFARAHKALVDEKKIEVYAAHDAAELLTILFDMRTTLIGKCSDDLLRKVNSLLLDAYTMLERQPQIRMNMRAM